MKHRLPRWAMPFPLLLLFIVGYAGYLISHCNDSTQKLDTLQGNTSILNGIQLEMQTQQSTYQDDLTSSFRLGDSLTGVHKFHAAQSEQECYYGPNTRIAPNLIPDISTRNTKYEGQIQYKTISDKLKYKCINSSTDTELDFPYFEITTPDNFYVHYDNHGRLNGMSNAIGIGTTAYVTLNGSRYFSISDVDFGEPLPYQVNGGIFKEGKNKIECVYDYTISSTSNNEIINLVALEDLNCLGLVVKEEDLYSLKIIDPETKEEKSRFALAKIPTPASDLLTPVFRVNYHAETKTLLVSATYYTPNGSSDNASKTLEEYFNISPKYEQYEEMKKAFDKEVTTMNTLISYTLQDLHTLTPTAAYDVAEVNSKLYEDTDTLLNADDFLYKDGILYLVTQNDSSMTSFPYIVALRGNDIAYEGYLKTDVLEDYRINRMGIDQYNLGRNYDTPNPLYNYYQRTMGQFKLSLTN